MLQAQSVAYLVATGEEMQRQCRDKMLGPLVAPEELPCGEQLDPAHKSAVRIGAYCHEWDEATQRVRGSKNKSSSGRQSKQFLMQRGHFHERLHKDGSVEVKTDPWLCKGLLLDGQSAPFILEGIVKGFPMPLFDVERFARLAQYFKS